MLTDADWLTTQVRYGYEVSGENFPPFGCLGRGTTTEAMGLRCVIASHINWYLVLTLRKA